MTAANQRDFALLMKNIAWKVVKALWPNRWIDADLIAIYFSGLGPLQ